MALPPGRARLSTKPAPTGSVTPTNTIGTVGLACSSGPACERHEAKMTSGASATNSAAYLRMRSGSQVVPPAILDPHVAAIGPAQLLQPLQERRVASLPFRIVRGQIHEYTDAPHSLGLLRPRRERPRCRRAAEQRDELAPPHSITSSARASSEGGISRPSALAVLRLMTSSYFVGA